MDQIRRTFLRDITIDALVCLALAVAMLSFTALFFWFTIDYYTR